MKNKTVANEAYKSISRKAANFKTARTTMEEVALDIFNAGPGSLTIVAGNSPALEVSMLAKIADDTADKGYTVAYINFMDDATDVFNTIVCRRSMVKRDHVYQGGLNADEWKRISNEAKHIHSSDYDIEYFRTDVKGTDDIFEFVESLGGVHTIVIDNMWMLAEPGENWGIRCELEAKRLAVKHDAAVILGTNSFYNDADNSFANKFLRLTYGIQCKDGGNTQIVLVDRTSIDYKVNADVEYLPEYHRWKGEVADRE